MTKNAKSIISGGSVLALAASMVTTDLKAETASECFNLAGSIYSVSEIFRYEAWSISEQNGTHFSDPLSYHRTVRYQAISAMYGPLHAFVEQLSYGDLAEYAKALDISANDSTRAKQRLYRKFHLAIDIVSYSKTWQEYRELMVYYADEYEEISAKTLEFCNMLIE